MMVSGGMVRRMMMELDAMDGSLLMGPSIMKLVVSGWRGFSITKPPLHHSPATETNPIVL